MKNAFILLMFVQSVFCVAQSKIITRSGTIIFEASVPAFEEVKAKNEAVTCVLRPSTGEIACLALVKGFRFKVALMEEHFNENYAESNTYKKTTFRGKIEDFDYRSVSENAQDYVLTGKLDFHGKTNDVKTTASIKKVADGIQIVTNFSLLATDYDVKIPSLVKNKLTNKVNLKCEFVFKK